jgi:hypothetical protein
MEPEGLGLLPCSQDPTSVFILSQTNQIHSLQTCFHEIHISIIPIDANFFRVVCSLQGFQAEICA